MRPLILAAAVLWPVVAFADPVVLLDLPEGKVLAGPFSICQGDPRLKVPGHVSITYEGKTETWPTRDMTCVIMIDKGYSVTGPLRIEMAR
jgi:hypothetical protein